ncbi:MAG: hypothetical protein IJS45_01435 [Clostridia bacterium]|nr:hypothetical protein [Clostridia bacterium]
MKIKSISFLGALAAVILFMNTEWTSLGGTDAIMKFYNDVNARYYANEKNEVSKTDYTDVKIADKYRIESILSKVEDDPASPFSHLVEYKFNSSVSGGNTLDADGFRALVKELYGAMTPLENENHTDSSSSAAGDAVRSAESLICRGVGNESVVSADGVRWYYSGNYIFSSERGKLGVVVRSPRGMTKGCAADGCGYFTSKRFFPISGVSSCGSSFDGVLNEEVLRVPSGGAFYVTREDYSSPLLVYFSEKS